MYQQYYGQPILDLCRSTADHGDAKSGQVSPYAKRGETLAKIFNKLSMVEKKRLAMTCPRWSSALETCREIEIARLQKIPEARSGFGRLPTEMVTKIFQKLSFEDKKNLRLVCPRWRLIVDYGMNFHVLLDRSALDWLKYFHKEMERHRLRTSSTNMVLSKINLPPVIQLTIGSGNTSEGIVEFLSHFSEKVTALNLLNYCLSHNTFGHPCVRSMIRMRWRVLGSLSITLGTKPIKSLTSVSHTEHIEGMTLFLKNAYTANLTHLTVNFDYDGKLGYEKKNQEKKPYVEVLAFIIRHKTSLQEINLSFIGSSPSVKSGTNLKKTKEIFPEKLLAELSTLHVVRFSILFDSYSCNIASTLVGNINPVKILKAHGQDWAYTRRGHRWCIPEDIKFRLGQMMKKHGDTMESLDIRCSYPSKIENFLNSSTPTPLTKVKMFIKVEDVSDVDLIVRFLGMECPKVKEVEVVIFRAHAPAKFSKAHLKTILQFPELCKLTLGSRFYTDFVEYCEELTKEEILIYSWERGFVTTQPDNINNYDMIVFKIDTARLRKKLL